MKREHWPVRLILGAGAVVIAGYELTFGGQTAQGVLMTVGLMMVAEALFDRRADRDGR
jgi:hypothetical protein